jgi:glycosyltransferase involved in cell wall biosynthesis
VYDLFVSLYRTADMRDVNPVLVKALWLVELVSLRFPDYHTVGTNQFIDLYTEMYRLPRRRFVRLPPGADEEWFHPVDLPKRDTFTAVYWGNFLPHHGTEVIVEAAERLESRGRDDIEVAFVGSGPRKDRAERLAERRDISNVRFEGFVAREVLQEWIATSHVALGVFSPDKRAMASITNKVSEAVAMRKAVVTERSPAIEEWFDHESSVYMTPPDDPDALADALELLEANRDLVTRLEAGGYEVYEDNFTPAAIGDILVESLELRP